MGVAEIVRGWREKHLTIAEILRNPEAYFEKVGLKILSADQMVKMSFQAGQRIEERIKQGKAYPTFLRPSNTEILKQCENQETIVIEVGGTNMRSSKWKVAGGDLTSSKLSNGKLLDENKKEKKKFADSDEFFDDLFNALPKLKDLIKNNPEATLSIVFSFPGQPVETEDGLDYRVAKDLTKEFEIPGLNDSNFIQILNKYLKDKCKITPKKMALFNDTANLLENNLGVVIGTGFNFALRMKVKQLRNILGKQDFAPDWDEEEYMIVNTESGDLGVAQNFFRIDDPNSIINRIDQRSSKKGEAMDEKLISGMYLREALRLVLEDLGIVNKGDVVPIEAEHISLILADNWRTEMPQWMQRLVKAKSYFGKEKPHETYLPFKVDKKYREFVKQACERIKNISEQVSFSLIKGGLDLAKEIEINANIEGSVFWHMPGYHEGFKNFAEEIFGDDKVEIKNAKSEKSHNLGSQYYAAVAGLQYFHDLKKRNII